MINVSSEFKELMKTRTDFKQYAEMSLADGAEWLLDESDFTITNNSYTDGAGANGLPLGAVIGRSVQIELMNDDERFAEVNFIGAKIRLYLTFQLSSTVEKIELGTFTVITPETYGETVIISAVDDAYKLDKKYFTSLALPQTLGSLFRDACRYCDVPFKTASFNNYDFVVEELPDGIETFRQLIGYIAMIAGGNARFDRSGDLEILTYSFPTFSTSTAVDYDGGNFENWNSGDNLNGGSFSSWYSADSADGGGFNPWEGSGAESDIVVDDDTHLLYRFINLKKDTDDVIITGIQTTATLTDDGGEEYEETVLYGKEGYVISVENLLIRGKESEALELIGDVLIGHRIRRFEGDHTADPTIEFMDKAVVVDRKGRAAATVITDVNFTFFGTTTLKNSAESPLRLTSQYLDSAAKAVIAAKKLVEKEKTDREVAIENLNKQLETASGLYTTNERQADGSVISYLHDKPELADSQTVIKITAEAIGVSNDGGKTYQYGVSFDGEAIIQLLQTEGVNADWIDTGALTVKNKEQKVIFQADVGVGSVLIDTEYFKLGADGRITATGGAVGGWTVTPTQLYSELGEGALLDAASGVVRAGNVKMESKAGDRKGYIISDDEMCLEVWANNEIWFCTLLEPGEFGDVGVFRFDLKTGYLGCNGLQVWNPVSVKSGGTGAKTGKEALYNLGVISGREELAFNNSNYTEGYIQFGEAYDSEPVLTITPQHDSEADISVKIKSIDANGATYSVRLGVASSIKVLLNWIAIGVPGAEVVG